MRIKELEDVLRLIDELPERRQRECVKVLERIVEDWEAQIAEGADDVEWLQIKARRIEANVERIFKKKPPWKGGL
jgi:hypothetical protein